MRAFRSVHSLPLMRTKNGLDEYLDGDVFVSEEMPVELPVELEAQVRPRKYSERQPEPRPAVFPRQG